MRTYVRGSEELQILHADLDAFYRVGRAARRPAAAGPARDRRRRRRARRQLRGQGVRRPHRDGRRQARRLCPDAVVVAPRMSAYSEASKAVFEVFEHTTPLVEGLSIDEAFLDVRGLRRLSGTSTEIAARLRRDVRERVGLPITVGVARTKFLAKVASAVAKPDGLLVVPPDGELDFLHPASGRAAVGRRPGDRRQASRAGDRDRRRGRPARRGGAGVDSRSRLGPPPARPRPTTTIRGPCGCGRRRGSIGSQRALGRSPRSPADLDAVLVGLVDRVTRRMRAAGRVGRTVVLRLRFDDFSRATRSHTLHRATAETAARSSRRPDAAGDSACR